ncbi:MAG: DUF4339 domain-containing protein [Verrucomicrobiales bacterium]|nr:DUF4339 domain-containing protein [Verrucomicrobiales bacterium]
MEILQGVQYHYSSAGQRHGPVEGTQLIELAQQGQLQPDSQVWTDGMDNWESVSSFTQLQTLFPAQPPPVPASHAAQPPKPMGDDAGMRMLLPVGRSGWAIAAGYAGLFALLFFPGPIALILGIIALIDIQKSKKTGKPKHGMGRAIFALIIGGLTTIGLLIMIVGALTVS